jgi:hypothetical protein
MNQETLKVINGLVKREFNPAETLKVLQQNIMILWSWAPRGYTNLRDLALIFRVSARRHKGYVVITLDWNDTYIVTLMRLNGTITKTFEGVYFDQLVETIDNEIERISEYSF